MQDFGAIEAMARGHQPYLDARLAAHGRPRSPQEMADTPDDRWLSMMTRCVFQAGFVWKVIEAKWSGFEAAFDGFDPVTVSFYSDDDVARLASDERIVRNGQKILATVHNAGFVADVSKEHGGFGRFMAEWPASDQPGLLELLKKKARVAAFGYDGAILPALFRLGCLDPVEGCRRGAGARRGGRKGADLEGRDGESPGGVFRLGRRERKIPERDQPDPGPVHWLISEYSSVNFLITLGGKF